MRRGVAHVRAVRFLQAEPNSYMFNLFLERKTQLVSHLLRSGLLHFGATDI